MLGAARDLDRGGLASNYRVDERAMSLMRDAKCREVGDLVS